ncbi:MAG: metallophosphoesterase [Endomicrobia bacterium]|nr:metallophosphoesterase [Endomicrobiia bacterium]
MGVVVIFVSYCVIGDFISFLFIRRNNKYIGLGVLLVSLISSTLATYHGIKMPKIKQITIDLDGNNSFRIVYLSDLHLDFKYKNKIAIELFNKIKNIGPGILIFGGDMFDPGFVYDVKLEEAIKRIYCTKIAILGNHDYYFGLEKAKGIFKQLGFIVLQNSTVEIENVNIIGLGDIRTEDLHKEEIVSIINNNYKTGKLNIVVSHQPLFFDELSSNFDIMMLSGHTHNGQVFPFHIFTRIFYKYLYGLFKKNKSTLYVTSGAGVWGPTMRFLSSSEVVVIDIL